MKERDIFGELHEGMVAWGEFNDGKKRCEHIGPA